MSKRRNVRLRQAKAYLWRQIRMEARRGPHPEYERDIHGVLPEHTYDLKVPPSVLALASGWCTTKAMKAFDLHVMNNDRRWNLRGWDGSGWKRHPGWTAAAEQAVAFRHFQEVVGLAELELTLQEQEEVYGGPLPKGLTLRRWSPEEQAILDDFEGVLRATQEATNEPAD